jgi:hypothetical protein
MAYISAYQYYENGGVAPTDSNWGSYQYVSLEDLVNNFLLMYQGNHSLVNNEPRYKILFHAKRGIQELNYDAFKQTKVLQLNVCDTLRFILPPDYVNWIRVSLWENDYLFPLTENIQAISATSYLQDNACAVTFDGDGNVQITQSKIDKARLDKTKKSIYLNANSPFDGQQGWNIDGTWYFDIAIGARFGLNTETANSNPTFRVDQQAGVINFSSGMAGKSCILEYVSDGLYNGDNTTVTVNKLFEEYLYAYIEYSILRSKHGVQEYIVKRAQKQKSALLRNAKIRLSNIHPGRLLMNLRGQAKWIK